MSSHARIIAETNALLQSFKAAGIPIGGISDGYHTIDELHEHRYMLFLALVGQMRQADKLHTVNSFKSQLHHDGTEYPGWFIAGFKTSFGWISYHLPMKHWTACDLPEWEQAPEWDGHTSLDVLERLSSLI
jgi:hypothetical protein